MSSKFLGALQSTEEARGAPLVKPGRQTLVRCLPGGPGKLGGVGGSEKPIVGQGLQKS